jgi:hypothetical protein
MKEQTYEKIYQESLKEMAVVGFKQATPKWPGMKIEVETSEFHGTGEEAHAHLYPANHKSGDKKDLITRFALTDEPPETSEDVRVIKGNPPLTIDYKNAIFQWSQENNKRGINNWIATLITWDAIQASRPSSQISHT